MKIAILSDTHGNVETTSKAVELLKDQSVRVAFHCGDICGQHIVEMLSEWDVHYVYGNCDIPSDMEWAIQMHRGNDHGLFAEITLDDRKIGMLHGHETNRLREAINSGKYDYLFHGHTHQIRDEKIGSTRVINPGALHRAQTYTFAILDLKKDELKLIEVPSS